MNYRICQLAIALVVIASANSSIALAQPVTISIRTPQSPPTWALLQRELLRANAEACRGFFERYFDQRGYLLCVERWGGDDGPDDAIENCLHWPILHALGADDVVLRLYKKAWEGHLRQFTEAKTSSRIPFASDGMYYKEFPTMFDWLHHSEGLTVFNLQGLSDPYNRRLRQRAQRYAGLYMNEDPGAPNYDPKHKIIRSMINGSRGPMLRKAKAVDWAGDPIEVKHRFDLRHGEKSYEQMLAHFKDYNDVVGDHPSNLVATSLALNAYALTRKAKYKKWILQYVDAWRERMIANGNIIPSNIGLDGKIGGAAGGRWYGGVYGWGFTVVVPQTGALAHRNTTHLGFAGFMNAYMLTGDDKYLDPWRKQADTINAQRKRVDGKLLYPHMYGRKGWYHFTPDKYNAGALEIYYLSMKRTDRLRAGGSGWFSYLDGKNPAFPEQALRGDLDRVRRQTQGYRNDSSTPDTRLSDDSMRFNPASVGSLIRLMLGGLVGGNNRLILHCRLRYFDPVQRRAGIPQDVAALVEKMTADTVTLRLVNTSQIHPRVVTIQAGGYAEHQFKAITIGQKTTPLDASNFTVRLAPGAAGRLHLRMKRYVNPPTLAFP